MNNKNAITTKEYWTSTFFNASKQLRENDPIRNWLEEVLIFNDIRNCIEIGCYPGKYLTIFGEKSIEINGLDYIDDVVNLKEYYSQFYKVGNFLRADALSYIPNEKYDCVMSFGLIEHFVNWDELLVNHLQYVSKKGFIIIEVPNFKGWMQRIPRFLFDKQNFEIHNLNAMNIQEWEKILINNNFKVIDKRYFGGYELWYEKNDNSFITKMLKSFTEKLLKKIRNTFYKNINESKDFSAYMGIVVKRN